MDRSTRLGRVAALVVATAAMTCCHGNEVDDEEGARAAYLGLDGVVEKALNLGMDGYNAASSANIPDQSITGDVSGTLTVSGQVDQGASDNKEMRLDLALVDYQDEVTETDLVVTYDTDPAAPPGLDLSLRDIPSGTFTGTLMGTFTMVGDIEGPVTLNLALSGEIEPGAAEGDIQRVVGSTTITGTATSDYGTYSVDISL
jgi:hypothetical protein